MRVALRTQSETGPTQSKECLDVNSDAKNRDAERICFPGRRKSVHGVSGRNSCFARPGKQTSFHLRGATHSPMFVIAD
jgi:hypothetical protein